MKTIIIDIRNNSFGATTVPENTFAVWRNLDPVPHSAETRRDAAFFFNVGPLLTGEISSPVLFSKAGAFPYVCRYHAGMVGTVTVVADGAQGKSSSDVQGHVNAPGHGHHLQHLHGFVTGGRTGNRLFMSHTPVLADPRHRFQVILQGSLIKPEHVQAYTAVRRSDYGDRRVQIFHEHLALPDIRDGIVKELPRSAFEYYPDPNRPDAGTSIPGLEENIPVRIDKVVHFHTFDVDADYPSGIEYLMYGDLDDIYIDHFINRGPSFHSVAKIAGRPEFWREKNIGGVLRIQVPSRRILDVSPKIFRRAAFVDNSYHLFYLPPSGVLTPAPQDPLLRRDGSRPVYEVVTETGEAGTIEIGRFLHFDVRLLNHGVLIL